VPVGRQSQPRGWRSGQVQDRTPRTSVSSESFSR
jgi:hypothetical protein